MLKKYVSFLTAALLIGSLAGCGSKTPDSVTGSAETTAVQTEASAETSIPVVFEETVIADNDYCTFKITAIDENNIWGYTLKVYLENKTDKDLTFSLDNVSVNGFMCDPFWAATITAGMKANEEISFSSDSFAVNGITTVTDIEFTLDVYDSNDWTAENLVSDTFSIYPTGENTAQTYVRESQESDILLFDNENCTMIVTGFNPDGIWGYTVNVYLENKTDRALMFSIDGAAVNGLMCDPFWAESVAPGKRSNTSISWMEADFEDNDITDVESLTLPIRVYDPNDWMASDFISETFTVNP